MCMRAQTYHGGIDSRAETSEKKMWRKQKNTAMLEAERAELASVSEFIYSRGAEVTSLTRGGEKKNRQINPTFSTEGGGGADFFKIGCNTPGGGHANDVTP